MNVLVLVPFKKEHMNRIREAAGPDATVKQLVIEDPKPFDTTMGDAILEADVVIGEPPIKLLQAEGVPVKWVQMTWAGDDMYTSRVVGLPEGMMLTNAAGGVYGPAVSQYVVAQVLSIMQNLPAYELQQRAMTWRDLGPNKSLEGARVLIYGAGDIGQSIAKRLSGFDCERVIGVCRNAEEQRPWFDELVTLPRAEFELPNADVVIGCLPGTRETKGYFSERRLRLIKPGGILVNVGRGNFIDLQALERVLPTGNIGGVVLDVTDPEPLPRSHPLWRNRSVVVTPHVAGKAFGQNEHTEERLCNLCCENLRRYVSGEELLHRVQ